MYINTTILLILTGTLAGIFFLALLASLFSLRKESHRNMLLNSREAARDEEINTLTGTCERLRTERYQLQDENRVLNARIAALDISLEEKEKQIASHNELLLSTREGMEKNFQILAEKIFSEKGKVLTRNHKEELHGLLQPVREQLGDFKKRIEDVYDRETRDRVSLVKEIQHLKALNQQISEDAVQLTRALKGQSKVQGLWGEMILEHLLENSGLKQGQEFEVQIPLKDKNGKTRLPDVLVHLPGKREIIIDAKVSLKAYEKVCRADDREEKRHLLRQHTDSIKQHVRILAEKKYHLLEGVNSIDFVVMFIPTEGAFQAAVSSEPELLTDALQKKIILASPSTLIAILRTVDHLWRQEEQAKNSLAIAKQAGSLYDKFIGFLESFEEIGARLHQTQNAWQAARNRLTSGRGNLVSRAETLKELGVQSSKSIPVSMQEDTEYLENQRRLP